MGRKKKWSNAEYFTHFRGDDILAMMITGTNAYAEQKIAELRHTRET